MATNKHALIRYLALDKCFRNPGRRYSIDDLIDECSKELQEFSGDESGVKKRQVLKDIDFMTSANSYEIPLEKYKDGRRVYYRYTDRNFSIKNQPLNETEAIQLKETLITLSRFKGLPQFEWVSEIITRLESEFSIESDDQVYISGAYHCGDFVLKHKEIDRQQDLGRPIKIISASANTDERNNHEFSQFAHKFEFLDK